MSLAARIVVVGSCNSDYIVRVPRLPSPGETIIGGDIDIVNGGKGANQAVASARLGAIASLVGRVGSDANGDAAMHKLVSEGVDVTYLKRDSTVPTGAAMVAVETSSGENSIIVSSGANSKLNRDDIFRATAAIAAAHVLVCQLEVPVDSVAFALKVARTHGVITILNPAPYNERVRELLEYVDFLVPNEIELSQLSGQTSEDDAIAQCLESGCHNVVVTKGPRGARFANRQGTEYFNVPFCGPPIDTTAAGDCFIGAFAVAFGEGLAVGKAIEFANTAAAVSVTRPGAQSSLPYRSEIDSILRKL